MTRNYPTTLKGVLVVLAIVAAVLVFAFTATLGGLALGIVLIALVFLLAYALGYRLDRWLRERQFFGGDG